MHTADRVCGGRLMMCHEGGYDASTVPYMGLAVLEELSGIKTDIDDPLLEVFEQIGGQDLQPHQDAVIRQAESLLDTSQDLGDRTSINCCCLASART